MCQSAPNGSKGGCKDHRHDTKTKLWAQARKFILKTIEVKRVIYKAVKDKDGKIVDMKDTGKRLKWSTAVHRTRVDRPHIVPKKKERVVVIIPEIG